MCDALERISRKGRKENNAKTAEKAEMVFQTDPSILPLRSSRVFPLCDLCVNLSLKEFHQRSKTEFWNEKGIE